jgi:hypothetical protein
MGQFFLYVSTFLLFFETTMFDVGRFRSVLIQVQEHVGIL